MIASARSARARIGTGGTATETGRGTESGTGATTSGDAHGAARGAADGAPAGSTARRRSGSETGTATAAGGRSGITTTSATGTGTETRRGRGSAQKTRGAKERLRSGGTETSAKRSHAIGRRRRASVRAGAAAGSAGTRVSAPARNDQGVPAAANTSSRMIGKRNGNAGGGGSAARVARGSGGTSAARSASGAGAAKAQIAVTTAHLDDGPVPPQPPYPTHYNPNTVLTMKTAVSHPNFPAQPIITQIQSSPTSLKLASSSRQCLFFPMFYESSSDSLSHDYRL